MTTDAPLPQPEPTGARTVVSGGLWSLGASMVTIVASLIATPFVLRGFGSELYGVFSLIQIVVGYLAIADFGTGDASTRFSADAHARHDRSTEVAAVWTALVLQLAPSLVVLIGLTAGAEVLAADVLRLPAHVRAAAEAAFPIAGLAMVAKNMATVFNSPQVVRLKFRALALINAFCGVTQIAAVAVLVHSGGSLAASIAVILGTNLLGLLCHAAYAARLLPEVRRPRVDLALAAEMARYGGWMVLVTLVITVLMQTEKVLISRFASPSALAHYAVAFNLASALALAPRAIKGVLFPIFSRMQAGPSRDPMVALYGRIVRLSLLFIAPVAVVLCIVAEPFLTVWAGEEYGVHSTTPFYILTVGFLLSGLASIPVVMLKGLARVDLLARFNLIQIGPFVVVAGLLTWSDGARGGAIAFALRSLADAMMHFGAVRRLLGIRVWEGRSQVVPFALAQVLVAIPLVTLAFDSIHFMERLVVTAVFVVGYAVVTWRWNFTPDDRRAFGTLIGKISGR